jgi:hypothetical protein
VRLLTADHQEKTKPPHHRQQSVFDVANVTPPVTVAGVMTLQPLLGWYESAFSVAVVVQPP